MADELNTPNHRYYQNRYNVELAPNEMSKQWILASGIARIDNAAVLPLFASAEPGTWYDPSDLTTLFTDTAGTTPVTAPGQTVGLMLDKSQGLVLGSELVTNGTFASGTATGWTTLGNGAAFSNSYVVGGALQVSNTTEQNPATSIGSIGTASTIRITFDARRVGGNNIAMVVRLSQDFGANIVSIKDYGNISTTWSTYTLTFVNSSVSRNTFSFREGSGSGGIFEVDNISVKLLAGNHATQATSTQRPTYGINPIVGTRNLLTYTEQFDNAVWNALSGALVITPNTVAAPDGTMTADSVALANGFKLQALTVSVGVSYTFSVYLRTDTGTKNVQLREANGSGEKTVTVTTEWQRFTLGYDSINATNYLGIDQRSGTSPSQSGTLYIWGAQLEASATATAYQKVVSQYEVTEAGVQSAGYLRFDGVDDGMVTNTITPNTDKVQVFMGVRKLSDTTALIAELSATRTSNAGSWSMIGTTGYSWASRGSLFPVGTNSGVIAAPSTNVLTGIGGINDDLMTFRVNGAQVETSSVDQGTGNYLAYPLYIGRRGGTTLPFNGRLYSLITRFGANLTDSQIASTESWVNAKTGAY